MNLVRQERQRRESEQRGESARDGVKIGTGHGIAPWPMLARQRAEEWNGCCAVEISTERWSARSMGAARAEAPGRDDHGGARNRSRQHPFISRGGYRSGHCRCTAATRGASYRTVTLVPAGSGMRCAGPRKQTKRTRPKTRTNTRLNTRWTGEGAADGKESGLQGDCVSRHQRHNRARFASQAHKQESTLALMIEVNALVKSI